MVTGDPIPFVHIKYPCVVKASKGEDTKAVRLVKDQQSLDAAIEHALTFSNQVIIERYDLVLSVLRFLTNYSPFQNFKRLTRENELAHSLLCLIKKRILRRQSVADPYYCQSFGI